MRSLSTALLAAQRSASRKPYVDVDISEQLAGVAKLRWERLYTGSETESFHAACCYINSGNPTFMRFWSDPDAGDILKANFPVIGPTADYGSWATWFGGIPAWDIACHGYGSHFMCAVFVQADGDLYAFDETVTPAAIATLSADATYRVAVAMKNNDNALCIYSDDADVYAATWTRGGGWSAFNKWTLAAMNSITGLAVNHQGDYNVMITGIDADGRPGVWVCVYGDGYSAAPGSWSALYEQNISDNTSVGFHFPSLAIPDIFRAFYIEAYSGTVAYSRPYWTHGYAGEDWITNLWREPVPFNLSSEYGIDIFALDPTNSTGQVYLSVPAGVWAAELTPRSIDVSADVLEIKQVVKPYGGAVEVLLSNEGGQYNDIGAGATDEDMQAIERGNRLDISFGYHSTEGAETPTAEPSCYITAIEHIVSGGGSNLALHGQDGWSLLEGWRSKRQWAWQPGEKNIFHLLTFLFARAGLLLSTVSASDALINRYPAFTVHPGESAAVAVRRLLDMVPDVLFFSGDRGYLKNPSPDDESTYSYGSDHPVIEGRYADRTAGASRVQVYGDGVLTEDWRWDEVELAGDRLSQVSDIDLDTADEAHQRGQAVLRRDQLQTDRGGITVPMNCGQDLYDVIAVDSPQAGLNGAKRRVVWLSRLWMPLRAKYLLKIGLGAV